VKLYLEDLHGKPAADELQTLRWQIPLDDLKKHNADGALDQPVMRFATGKQYEATIYGKGALFYDALRKTVGDRQFTAFLQRYLANHRYQIVDSADWLAAIRTLNNPTVDKLYQEWVQQPVVRTPNQPSNGP